eukprot:14019765-Heterocapsa_arctica.AAC.1
MQFSRSPGGASSSAPPPAATDAEREPDRAHSPGEDGNPSIPWNSALAAYGQGFLTSMLASWWRDWRK